jgi:xylan 1,4-beta-xylosidase
MQKNQDRSLPKVNNQSRVRNAAFAVAVAVASGFYGVQAATVYNITVEAGTATSVLNRFWEKCVGADHMYTVINTAYGGNIRSAFAIAKNELGIKSVRAHGILNDDVGIYKEDGSGNPVYNWKNYDTIMDYVTSLGWKPIVELSFMPAALASGSTTTCWYNGVPGNVTKPKDYVKWQNLIYEIVKHSATRYGAAEIEGWRWEIWNEPDINPQFFTGTYDDYLHMYDYAVEGAIKADSNIKIGGPASALSDTAGLLKQFLSHCISKNYANSSKSSTRVDFLSWHQYPWNEGDQNATAFAPRHRGIATFIKRYPTLKLENLQTEWNASARYNYFDDECNASFAAKAVHSLFPEMNQGVAPPDVFSFWVISDIFEEANLTSTSAFAGAMGMILRQRDAKKPSFNAFKMLHMLGDSCLALTGGTTADRGLNGIATINKTKDQVQVLIYDHNFGTGANPAVTMVTDSVHLQVKNLPFATGTMKVDRYGVDKNHSNSFTTWVNQGRPAKPTTAQWDALKADGELKKLDSTTTVTLTGTTFSKNMAQFQPGVSLLVLSADKPTKAEAVQVPAQAARLSLQGKMTRGIMVASYSLAVKARVTLSVVNTRGETILARTATKEQEAGDHLVTLGTIASGSYFCVLRAGNTVVKAAMVPVVK